MKYTHFTQIIFKITLTSTDTFVYTYSTLIVIFKSNILHLWDVSDTVEQPTMFVCPDVFPSFCDVQPRVTDAF